MSLHYPHSPLRPRYVYNHGSWPLVGGPSWGRSSLRRDSNHSALRAFVVSDFCIGPCNRYPFGGSRFGFFFFCLFL